MFFHIYCYVNTCICNNDLIFLDHYLQVLLALNKYCLIRHQVFRFPAYNVSINNSLFLVSYLCESPLKELTLTYRPNVVAFLYLFCGCSGSQTGVDYAHIIEWHNFSFLVDSVFRSSISHTPTFEIHIQQFSIENCTT
jgi:hypothetical protein